MSYKALKIKPLNKGGTVAALEKTKQTGKKTVRQKEAEFGLPFQAQGAASADTNIYGHAFVNAIEAVERSYHPDVIRTNSNPQLNLGFVPFGRQPPRFPSRRVLEKAKQMQEQTRVCF